MFLDVLGPLYLDVSALVTRPKSARLGGPVTGHMASYDFHVVSVAESRSVT